MDIDWVDQRRKKVIYPLFILAATIAAAWFIFFFSKAIPIANAVPVVEASLFATGLNTPTGIYSTGIKSDTRLFVLKKNGVIKVINQAGVVHSPAFLDIRDKVKTDSEMGLLGLAFSPNYAKDGHFFINYVDKSQYTVIARYRVSGDRNFALKSSERKILRIKQPYGNHKAGDMHFGLDGYLYIALGDGGSGGDPGNRAQDLSTLLGKILRIDVSVGPYRIPKDNPYVGDRGRRPEIWSWGLRNPWRFSIDKPTNQIYIADVGQGSREEINIVFTYKAGLNYGWRCYEGSLEYNINGCRDRSRFVFPRKEYAHNNGRCSITGGQIYRGKNYTSISGMYFYADYCSGELFWGKKQNGIFTDQGSLETSYNIAAFGQNNQGELYFADFATGDIYNVQTTGS